MAGSYNEPYRKEVPCMTDYLVLGSLLLVASTWDVKTGKIPNHLIITGYILGFLSIWIREGVDRFWIYAIRAVWPLLQLYGLFYIKAVGAGDIKLLSVISVFFTFDQMVDVMTFFFAFSAMASLIKIIISRWIFGEKVKYIKLNQHLYYMIYHLKNF